MLLLEPVSSQQLVCITGTSTVTISQCPRYPRLLLARKVKNSKGTPLVKLKSQRQDQKKKKALEDDIYNNVYKLSKSYRSKALLS